MNCIKRILHLYEKQFDVGGFEWVDLNHREETVMVYKRMGVKPKDDVLVILNMTPQVRNNWEVHVQNKKNWKEIFNSDSKDFWGTGDVYNPDIQSEIVNRDSKWYKLTVNLPPLGGIVLI